MQIMKRVIILSFIVIFFSTDLPASYPTVRNYYKKEMNSGTQNWDMFQHQNNWMYFANNNGLLEFDGYRWNIYSIGNYTDIRSLYYDEPDNKIYAGAYNEFGYYSRDERGLLNYRSLTSLIDSTERDFSEIWHIDRVDENLFFQSNKEVFRYSAGQIKRIKFAGKIEYSKALYDMFIVSGITEGVFFLNGDIFISLPGTEILKGKKVCSILPFKENEILFVTDFHGLFLYDGTKTTPYKTDIDDFLRENQVFCAALKNNKLALGTVREGLVVKDLVTNENIYANVYSGLQNNTVLSIFFDNVENLWLGLDKGISYVMINSPIYDLFGNNQLYGAGYSSIIIDNYLYLGTNQGLYTTSYPIAPSPAPLKVELANQMSGQVWSLKKIDNTLFCGTDHGTFIIKGNSSRQIPGIPGTWNFQELKSHPGYILGSSYSGFFMLKKENNTWKFSHWVKGFPDSGGLFEEDKSGNIWFAHWIKGIFKLTFNGDLDCFSAELFDTSKGFYVNTNNVLFKIDDEILFSSDGGFFRHNPQTNRIEHAEEYEKLFGQYPYSLHLFEMPSGDIFCISQSSIRVALIQPDKTYKVDATSFEVLKNKLIPGFENFNAIDSSNVLVSTEDGFSRLNLEKAPMYESTKYPFKVAIKNIYFTNGKDSLACGVQDVECKNIPKFNYSNNSVRFEFVAPEFRYDQAVLYSYRMDNYDSDWSLFSLSNTKEYTRLPKGDYTFKVRAKNMLESETVEASYKFTILPPWYESTTAYTLYLLLSAFLLYLLILLERKHSEKGVQKMKIQKEKEIHEKETFFKAETKEKEKEIIALKNQKLQYELRHKSQELASSTMNVIRKNEILLDIGHKIEKIASGLADTEDYLPTKKHLQRIQQDVKLNIERDDNWKKFEENFDMIYENYLKRLKEKYPSLTVNDKKLCAYLKMGLSSKEIAPLLDMSFRSVEMSRYRLRKKINLSRDENLTDFLQNF